MANSFTDGTPLTILLPADLLAELQRLAQEKDVTVDAVVREACSAYVEPQTWERCYRDLR